MRGWCGWWGEAEGLISRGAIRVRVCGGEVSLCSGLVKGDRCVGFGGDEVGSKVIGVSSHVLCIAVQFL